MQLRTEIEIAADPARVWDTLVGFASYPDWNPWVRSVEGELAVGSVLTLTVTPADGSERRERVTVTALEPGRSLRWTGKLVARFLFAGEHYFELTELGVGRTRLTQGENLSGAMVQHLGQRLTGMARGFVGMNEALKKRLERASD